MIVVAYYTQDTGYEQEIQNLKKSCLRFNLSFHFVGYKSRGSWLGNCAIKPEFCLAMLEKFAEDILYLDADAIIQQYPNFFDTFSGDIGVHYRRDKELLSGTIFFRNSDRVKAFVQQWIFAQKKNPLVMDQKVLQKELEKSDLKIVKLPPTYTQIFDLMRGVGQPVIEHFQASRRFKRKINEHITPRA